MRLKSCAMLPVILCLFPFQGLGAATPEAVPAGRIGESIFIWPPFQSPVELAEEAGGCKCRDLPNGGKECCYPIPNGHQCVTTTPPWTQTCEDYPQG